MKVTILALLSILLLLTSCTAPEAGMDAQTSATPTVPGIATSTLFQFTETPVPTSTLAPTDTLAASPQPGILSIRRLQMIDANVGWAEGSVTREHDPSRFSDIYYYLLRTTDGGGTWQDVTPPTPFTTTPGQGSVVSLFAIDADTAWATPVDQAFSQDPPYTLVWRTTDGGKSWRPSNPIDISASPGLVKLAPWLQFVDEKHGWLTFRIQMRIESYDLQYRTRDGGITWEEMEGCYTFDGARQGCNVPQFTDSQTGWLMNVPGYTPTWDVDPATIWRVRRSLDAGQTWQTINLPHSQEAKGCFQSFTRIRTGIAGMRMDCTTQADLRESYYYLSADQGQTWQIIPSPGNVFFLDMTTGWRLSEMENGYRLEKTTDGGGTWQTMSEQLHWKGGFQFVDADHGWAAIVDDLSDPPREELQRTTDGGKTWVKFTPQLLPADTDGPAIARLEAGYPLVFQSIQMIDSLGGWAIGMDGYAFHTLDGGKTWQDVTPLSGRIHPRRGFFALDAGQAWTTVAYPTYDAIWSTGDGGQSWQQVVTLSEWQFIAPGSLHLLNENIGWFQWSERGNPQELHLMKTMDRGVTWEEQATEQYSWSYEGVDRMGFMFLAENNGFRIEPVGGHTLEEFLSDSPALISKTTDGGVTWQPVDLPNMVLDANEISLNQEAYPGGIPELMQDTLSCNDGNTLRAFSPDTIGLGVICKGLYRDVYGTYGYVFVLSQYYLSTDAGASWSNWMSFGDDLTRNDDDAPVESEFFLPDGLGWRLKANQLLQTTDGGNTWIALKAVGWDEAQFDFINPQEGWGIVKSGKAISLVHTLDGGNTWEEIKPVVAP